MATASESLAAVEVSSLDQRATWLWNLLKKEFSPYPGRAWIVGRMTIAATLVMVIVMVFRIPGGFQGAIFTLFISRENLGATLRSALHTIAAVVLATIYSVITLMMLIDNPLTHFLWVLLGLLLSFLALRVWSEYPVAAAFAFTIAGAITFWDNSTLNYETRLENTLWLMFITIVGIAVAVIIEYVFVRAHPETDLTQAMENRLAAVEAVVRRVGSNLPIDEKASNDISVYASVGTSRLRLLLDRSGYSPYFKSQMNAAIALLGRLVDLTASFDIAMRTRKAPVSDADRARCLALAEEMAQFQRDLLRNLVTKHVMQPGERSELNFLPAMEITASLIPKSFTGVESLEDVMPAPLDIRVRQPYLAPDAFTNVGHLQFVLRGTFAAIACYIVYNAVDWRGISTAMPTCIITALTTVGSSRQKQFLRFCGAVVGGAIGIGSQMFILPYLNSIAGFTLLFALVTALSAWIATSSARLSYLGIQLALAFYLINVQEFTIQTSLGIARDRVVGVLLGLTAMWLIFDRLWVRDALTEMQAIFGRNLEMFAELCEQLLIEDRYQAIRRIRILRDQINNGFNAMTAQADAVLFEFGRGRRKKLEIREALRSWQPSLRTLLLLLISLWQFRVQRPLKEVPEPIANAQIEFESALAEIMRALADEIDGRAARPTADIEDCARTVEQEIRKYFESIGEPLPARAIDVISLTQTMASILKPLQQDIHEKVLQFRAEYGRLPQLREGEA